MPTNQSTLQVDPNACFATFWMVMNDATSRMSTGLPTFRHSTERSAKNEAARLAIINPGITFFVLEATSACRQQSVEWLQQARREDVPF